jgi:hypothetical protein
MSASTGPVLTIGALTLINRSVFNDKPVDWKVPVGTAVAVVLFSAAERVVGRGAVYIAYLALVTMTFVRVDPKIPTPAESALAWFEKR